MILHTEHTEGIKWSSTIYKFLQQTIFSSLLGWNLQTSTTLLSSLLGWNIFHCTISIMTPIFVLASLRDQLSHKHKHQIKSVLNILISKHIVFANICCVNINLLHTTPMWTNHQNLYISLYQYQCVHDTLCMCMMTEYHLATYSWDLHTEHMQGFRIALPFPAKPDSHCSFFGISISLITDSM